MGADPARRRPLPGVALRLAERHPRRRPGLEPERQALRGRRRQRVGGGGGRGGGRLRPRRQMGGDPRHEPRPHRQHRLRRDRGRRSADQPHPLLTVFSREARVLFGERRHFRARLRDRPDAAGEGVLLAPHRHRRGRRGGADRVGHAAHRAGGGVEPGAARGGHRGGGARARRRAAAGAAERLGDVAPQAQRRPALERRPDLHRPRGRGRRPQPGGRCGRRLEAERPPGAGRLLRQERRQRPRKRRGLDGRAGRRVERRGVELGDQCARDR